MDFRNSLGSDGTPSKPDAPPAATSRKVILPFVTGSLPEIGELERELRLLRTERDDFAARFAALPRATANAAIQLAESDKALLAIRAARDAVMARSAELSGKLAQAHDEIAELTDFREFAERERDAAMEQLKTAQRECAELRAKLESLPAPQPAVSLAAGQSMAAMLAQYSAERTRLQQQLEEVRTAANVQAAALQAQLAARKHEAAAGGELERHRMEIAGLRAELDSLREELRESRISVRDAASEPPAPESEPPAPLAAVASESIVAKPISDAEAELDAMTDSLQAVEDDPSHLEALDVLASQFQDLAQKSLSAGNPAAHRLAGISADVAMWLRRSPMKIPAALPGLEKAHQLLTRLMDPSTTAEVGDPGGSTVYAVDDDVDNCECIAMALEKATLLTRYAIKAEVAIGELAKGPCDLIILDVDLGSGLDGFELHSRIRQLERHKNTPVLFVSGLTGTPERIAELTGERDAFVQKPYNLNELTLRVLTAILSFRLARS
jgi:CheY-like chemotaxis protein